jgi:predicted nucleic acid-binding protein
MKIVSNSSPLISLASINKLNLLAELFGEVMIPEKVYEEVALSGNDRYGSEIKGFSWIKVIKVEDCALKNYLLQTLDEGEAEVILLAIAEKADLVIIDERMGRKHAEILNLNIVGTLGILRQAKIKGIIPEIRSLIDEMIDKRIWFNKDLINRVLIELDETH